MPITSRDLGALLLESPEIPLVFFPRDGAAGWWLAVPLASIGLTTAELRAVLEEHMAIDHRAIAERIAKEIFTDVFGHAADRLAMMRQRSGGMGRVDDMGGWNMDAARAAIETILREMLS